ncbi:MAG TPA: TolC family protein, partial [Planctomycetaceae bacterium]
MSCTALDGRTVAKQGATQEAKQSSGGSASPSNDGSQASREAAGGPSVAAAKPAAQSIAAQAAARPAVKPSEAVTTAAAADASAPGVVHATASASGKRKRKRHGQNDHQPSGIVQAAAPGEAGQPGNTPARQDQAQEPERSAAPVVEEPSQTATSNPAGESKGDVKLGEAPLENGDLSYPINLATALRLADARPLVVAAAQASSWVAEAQLQRAQVIWVPTLNLGGDYVRHDGFGPDFNRGINTGSRPLSQNINFLYTGTGLTMGFALTDAIFEPLAAKQVLDSKRWDIQSAKNDALLATARAYYDVHQYRGQYAGAVDVVQRGEKLVDRITHLSEDLVPVVETDRAKRMLAAAQQNAATARQQWRVSSANLTQ